MPRWAQRRDRHFFRLGVPQNLWKTDFLDKFYAGWHELAEKHAVELVGGDISRSPDKFFVDSVVFGDVPKGKAAFRSGAKPGDLIFVTGFLGGAAAGLEILEAGHKLSADRSVTERHLLLKQLQPIPQVTAGNLLNKYSLPTSLIDISDGLSSDLTHILESSGVGARLTAETIPIDPAIFDFTQFAGRELELALNGGEDFEMLFTAKAEKTAVALDLGFHQIGEITNNAGRLELVGEGQVRSLKPRGYRHF